MQIHTNIPLANYTTMRLGGAARFFADVHSVEEVEAIIKQAKTQELETYILGSGSNTIAVDEGFNGIVIRNQIMGFEIVADDVTTTTIRVGAGEDWDETVKKTVERNLSGIEAMSGVPGTVGAAPVQNIGAYGQEVADVITMVEAYDTVSQTAVTLTPKQCEFSYRHSVFRGEAYERYVITAVTMQLYKTAPQPPFYQALQDYFDTHEVSFFTPQVVRDGVLAIRFAKLPDPATHPNAGSFFKNALVDNWLYDDLKEAYSDMPAYSMPDGRHKIPTGWLIEQCGLKGALLHGMRVHEGNALVLVNESASSYADLEAAMQEIVNAVRDKFRITIEREPLLLASPAATS